MHLTWKFCQSFCTRVKAPSKCVPKKSLDGQSSLFVLYEYLHHNSRFITVDVHSPRFYRLKRRNAPASDAVTLFRKKLRRIFEITPSNSVRAFLYVIFCIHDPHAPLTGRQQQQWKNKNNHHNSHRWNDRRVFQIIGSISKFQIRSFLIFSSQNRFDFCYFGSIEDEKKKVNPNACENLRI